MKFFARVFGLPFYLTPKFVRVGVAYSMARFVYFVLRFRRYTLTKNLAIAFPNKTKIERESIILASLESLIFGLFEFFSLPWLDVSYADQNAKFVGLEVYQEALARGKGVLLLSMHLGNGDFGCAMLAFKGIKLHLISKKFKVQWLNDFWFGVRESLGTQFIDPHNPRNSFEILSALRKKESVCFVLDQYMGKPYGVETQFFGKRVGTAYGLALFAKKTEAPVVPICTYREPSGRTIVTFGPEIMHDFTSDNENRDLQIQRATQQYNDWIESMIRQHPDQWMWIHRRWKRFK